MQNQFQVELRKLFNTYLEDRTHLSIRGVSNLTGLSRYFLGKVLDDTYNKQLDLSHCLCLIRYISEKNNITDAISVMPDAIKKEFENIFKVNLGEDKVIADNLGDINLYEKNAYLLLVLSTFNIKKEQAVKILGEECKELIKDFLKNEIILEKEKRLLLAQGTDLPMTFELLKHHIATYGNFYRPSHVGKNHGFMIANRVTKEKMAIIRTKCSKFYQEISALMHDEKTRETSPALLSI